MLSFQSMGVPLFIYKSLYTFKRTCIVEFGTNSFQSMGECNTHIYISIYKYTRVTLSHFHVTLSHYLCHTYMSHKYTSSHKYNLSHKYTLSHKHTLSHIVTNTFDLRYHKLYVYMYIHDTYT